MPVERKMYCIDFVHRLPVQQFTTGASLSENEVKRLKKKLKKYEEEGYIFDPQVYVPEPLPNQTLKQALTEIAESIGL